MNIFMNRKVNKIITEYNKQLFDTINNNKEKLINAFTIYYGNEYKDLISEKINNALFFTFLSKDIIQMMHDGYNNLSIEEKEKHKNFKTIFTHFKNKKNISKIFDNNISLPNNFKKTIYQLIKENDSSCAFQISNINVENKPIYLIFLGIGVDNQTIIHELNHVITDSILGYYKNDNSIELIEKIGITTSQSMEKGEALEDLLNDKSAYEINDIFHSIGGNISNYNLYSINAYPVLFPLVNKFYDKYKPLLKQARITDNQNLLFKEIDKDNFIKYQDFISEQSKYLDKNYVISSNAIKEADELIKNLKKENNNSDDIQKYITYLKEQKRQIKVLNSNEETKSIRR